MNISLELMTCNVVLMLHHGLTCFVFLFSFSGLLITYVALNLMDGHGQPALLYIVPFTICK
jgi:hypothetical protein